MAVQPPPKSQNSKRMPIEQAMALLKKQKELEQQKETLELSHRKLILE